MPCSSTNQFIAIDGIDGCGKTTQVELLSNHLDEVGIKHIVVHDPGSTRIGGQLRQVLKDVQNTSMEVPTEILLFMASRIQLLKEVIKPALHEDKWVLIDRWLYSTYAYQGTASNTDWALVTKMIKWLDIPWPSATAILDLAPQVSQQRLADRAEALDRIEKKDLDYHIRVREGMLAIAVRRAETTLVDASQTVEQVHQTIIEHLCVPPFLERV